MGRAFFEDFDRFDLDVGETVRHGVRGGDGPPLLLHGYPQTHVMWHRVAQTLAERFTVVAPDLRGYGASGKPPSQAEHASHSKRAMAPHPEELISADSDRYFRGYFRYTPGAGGIEPFDADAFEHYLAALRNPQTVRASCEDYRAAATIDIAHDDADEGRRVGCPLRVLWGEYGVVHACFDPLALWRERADEVSGPALPAGHYLAEELPDVVLDEMSAFFGPDRGDHERSS